MKATVIVNPVSSRIADPDRLRRVEKELARHGFRVTVSTTTAPLEAIALARRAVGEGSELVISAGGDGTLNEVINGIVGSGARLGIIPAGLSNVLALELGIPADIDRAVGIITGGHTRRIDLGIVNQRYFAIMVSVGLDAEAVRIVNPALKRYVKRYAYYLAGLKALIAFRPRLFKLLLDGERELSGSVAVISNARFYGGPHQITPGARIDDGFFHCCLFEKGSRRDYARYFLGVLRKKHHTLPDVTFARARSIRIDDPGLPLQADGDYIGRTPARIELLPARLEVLVPAGNE
ncbi:MAG: diacylglycerol kinase family protein [PVC group bacterium]